MYGERYESKKCMQSADVNSMKQGKAKEEKIMATRCCRSFYSHMTERGVHKAGPHSSTLIQEFCKI